MNELSKETSPYLLQHAENPVHWKAWNSESLASARQSDKLIILSSGYSACHWCHVMEHESFEDESVARTMNTHYVSIKVDREERPDVDAVYMKAVQLMSGRGGWPLNVVCLPDGRPVWGGSYVPKNEWVSYLEQLAAMYQQQPEKLIDYAERLHNGMQSMSIIEASDSKVDLSHDLLKPLVQKWAKSFDKEYGGYARAPKFMMPTDHVFLLSYGFQYNKPKLIEHVNLSLTRMAWGGLFDTVGGGFSRYSVDMEWHVPHFEKMLYDNAQLVSLYANAYKLSKNSLYKEVIEKTLQFIEREMSNGEGGFYSALDADSIDGHGSLREGAFYVWDKPTLQSVLKEDFDLFADVFNVNEFGYWEEGHYVLIQNRPLNEIADAHKISLDELQQKKHKWEQLLLDHRAQRVRPRLDDKCLTSWNALMLKGYVEAYKALGTEEYLQRALSNADFIKRSVWTDEGNLMHSYKNGKSTINGYLEDYCFVINAFIALFQVTLDEHWLHDAKQLTNYCFDHFYDPKSGFFSFTSNLEEGLITKHYEIEDNVIPASNSVMAGNLHALSVYFGNMHYEEVYSRMLMHIIPNIDYPSAFSNWLAVYLESSCNNFELAVCGSSAVEDIKYLSAIYLPHVLLAGSTRPSDLPFLSDRFKADETLYYVCKNKSCDLPQRDLKDVVSMVST
ncbi:MAG TPA: thioredoxin domain-containing protein [Flavobacterium sp.]|jgi:hypothetical protein